MKSFNSKIYTNVLFEYAIKNKVEIELLEDLKSICSMIKTDPLMIKFFRSPCIKQTEKVEFLKSFPALQALFKILIFQNAITYLPKILKDYEIMLDKHLGREEIIIACAKTMTLKKQSEIKKRFIKNTDIQFTLDPSLLDGFRVYWKSQMLPLSSKDLLLSLSEVTA